MIDRTQRAERFRDLHQTGNPVVLYNIWDAGGAKVLQKAGAQAVATGSWSVAAAHGYPDGEAIPLDFLVQIVDRITATTNLPLSVDFEGGYAVEPEQVAANAKRIMQAGAIGINFEDRIVGGEGLHTIPDQVGRIAALRDAAGQEGVDLFINARTDLFLGSDPATHTDLVAAAADRGAAYKDAGASGFFVPGLADLSLVKAIVDAVDLPVNVMMRGEALTIRTAADAGVARVSYGPGPYATAMSDLKERFGALV